MSRYAAQRRRFTLLLAGIFAVLFAASALIVTQAFDRLRYEAFYAQRVLAEEFARRVRDDVRTLLAAESDRPPTDYDFLVVSGERYVRRSPLSSLPPETALPGLVGYFQVDAAGTFSTPLLPKGIGDPAAFDLTDAEYETRRGLQQQLQGLLEVGDAGGQPATAVVPTAVVPTEALPTAVGPTSAGPTTAGSTATGPSAAGSTATLPAAAPADQDAPVRLDDAADELRAVDGDLAAANRALFNQLTGREQLAKRSLASADEERVEGLKLRQRYAEMTAEASFAAEASMPREAELQKEADPSAARVEAVKQVLTEIEEDAVEVQPTVSVFESAIDPFQLSRLGDSHLLLYRSVWLDEQRSVQGAVLELAPFLKQLIGRTFAATALAASSDLVVAFQGDVLGVYRAGSRDAYALSSAELEGELLLTTNLAAPADELQLVFSAAELPFGAGGVALFWSTAVVALVLCGGFVALLLLGRRQIQLAEQREDFVSAVSHELKTPLTSIRMYGEMLRAGWVDEDKRRTYYDYIFNESERLSRMIGNVLTLARLGRSAQEPPELKPLSVSTLLDTMESSVQSALDSAGLALKRDYQDAARAASVEADEDAFLQVMINLVDNAIKFSTGAAEQAVELGCTVADGHVEFRVRDFGPGVAKDQMRKIFRLFYRAESELTRETVGTGIGLALVRELSDQMRGSVDVVNREPGAEFRLRLRQVAAS